MTGQERAAAIRLLGEMLQRNLGNRLTPELSNGMLDAMESQLVIDAPTEQPPQPQPGAPHGAEETVSVQRGHQL